MIHYHGTPMGGKRDDVPRILRGRHAFVSFASQEDLGAVAECCESFAFDNGAFSAWKKGVPLDFDGYWEWCAEWHRHPGFDWCIIPDVIDGTEVDNHDLIAAWISKCQKAREHFLLLKSVPVYHMHERVERLWNLINLSAFHFGRVAIGSSGQWPNPGTNGWKRRMDEIMQVACDDRGRPRTRLHGLRMLSIQIFTKYPFASADSTNVAQNHGGPREYKPPTPVQSAEIIAARIEAHQSAAVWVKSGQLEFTLSGS